MSMDQPRRPTRTPGGPAGRSPRGSSPAIAVVVALVAAVVGFVILRSLGDDNGTAVSTGGGTETTDASTGDSGAVDTATVTTPTTVAIDRQAWNVLVANASGVKGSAGSLTEQLGSLGFKTLKATNATDPTKLDTTVVYYVIGADAIGADVAASIGKTAQPMPATLPVPQTDFVGGHVLVVLGTDLAGKPIPGAVVPETTQPPAAGGSPNST